jgi:hypothetical protein
MLLGLSAGSKVRNGYTMSSKIHLERSNATYRYSTTPTLSDFPLLIGEILRRSDRRLEKKAQRRSFMKKIRFTV